LLARKQEREEEEEENEKEMRRRRRRSGGWAETGVRVTRMIEAAIQMEYKETRGEGGEARAGSGKKGPLVSKRRGPHHWTHHEVYAIEVQDASVDTWKSETMDVGTVPKRAVSLTPKNKHPMMANK
jgi:hypothetical protein